MVRGWGGLLTYMVVCQVLGLPLGVARYRGNEGAEKKEKVLGRVARRKTLRSVRCVVGGGLVHLCLGLGFS